MCDMIHPNVRHDWVSRTQWVISNSMCIFRCVTWRIQMCDITHPNVWHDWMPRTQLVMLMFTDCSVTSKRLFEFVTFGWLTEFVIFRLLKIMQLLLILSDRTAPVRQNGRTRDIYMTPVRQRVLKESCSYHSGSQDSGLYVYIYIYTCRYHEQWVM